MRKKTYLARKIAREAPHIPKTAIAEALGISRGTLYLVSKQSTKDRALLERILDVRRDHPHYGHRRIAIVLEISEKVTRRVMKKYGLITKRRRKGGRKPRDEGNPPSGIPNRVKYLCPIEPTSFWAGDFTEFVWHGLKFYLATVIDLCTREIVGWSVGFHHTAEFVMEALEYARIRRGCLPRLFHSDQGSEYNSTLCKLWLFAHRMLPSHSKKASPWENGSQESFYKTLKKELGHVNRFDSIEEFTDAIAQFIFYYNTKRIHSALRCPPQTFYEQWLAQQKNEGAQPVIHSV